MTDRAQFEAMLEALINEDQESAKEIFHNIVVAKSREIYEELLESDFAAPEEAEEGLEEEFGAEEEEGEDEVGADDEEGEEDGEEADDEEGEESPFGDEEGGEEEGGDMEDRVMDLEDALEELKSEFEQLMAGEENEPEHADMFGGEEEPADEFGAEPEMSGMGGMGEMFREYTEKVPTAKMGDNGANTRSPLAKPNRMGGTSANIVRGGEAGAGGTKGGLLAPTTKEENFGNVNVPGGNAGKTGFKKTQPGHGAEKSGKKETSDKGAISPINGVKSRAK